MTDKRPVRVWLLLGSKAGDNAQIMRLAALLPGEHTTHRLSFNRLHVLPNLVLGAGLSSLATRSRATLVPPWPDLVIAAGKRSAPVSRWIRQNSGGAARTVHIGRPRAPLADFDLVITTPQYGLPQEANVLELPVPLSGIEPASTPELQRWQQAWSSLPRPLVGVAVGASKYPLRFERPEQEKLADLLNAELKAGGSVLLMGAPRTPAGVVPHIASLLTVRHMAYEFGKGNNPYSAALAICDRIVVTGDSASMIADALRSGKPVAIYRLPVSQARFAWSAKRGQGALLARSGLLQPPRAMDHLVGNLVREGLVSELGRDAIQQPSSDYEATALARVRQLLTAR